MVYLEKCPCTYFTWVIQARVPSTFLDIRMSTDRDMDEQICAHTYLWRSKLTDLLSVTAATSCRYVHCLQALELPLIRRLLLLPSLRI